MSFTHLLPLPAHQVSLLQGQSGLIKSALKTRIENYNTALEVRQLATAIYQFVLFALSLLISVI